MTHIESGSKQHIPDLLFGISGLMISRLIDLKPTGLDTCSSLSFAALGFEMRPQIAEMPENTRPLPAGHFDPHNTWFPPDFAGKVLLGLLQAFDQVPCHGIGEHYEIKN
jgi:hypothetical protein